MSGVLPTWTEKRGRLAESVGVVVVRLSRFDGEEQKPGVGGERSVALI